MVLLMESVEQLVEVLDDNQENLEPAVVPPSPEASSSAHPSSRRSRRRRRRRMRRYSYKALSLNLDAEI